MLHHHGDGDFRVVGRGVADKAQVGLGVIRVGGFQVGGFRGAGLGGDGHRVVGKDIGGRALGGHHLHTGLHHAQHIAGKARVVQLHRLIGLQHRFAGVVQHLI